MSHMISFGMGLIWRRRPCSETDQMQKDRAGIVTPVHRHKPAVATSDATFQIHFGKVAMP
jgi:hypothetical protein